MGRPRKSQNVSNSEIASSEANPTSDELIQKLLVEVENLKKQLAQKDSQPESKPKVEIKEEVEDEFDKIEISQDSYIKIMSLTPYTLNLSTEGKGRGKLFVFRGFGATKRILYSDLVKILETHQNFVDGGYFYILDKRIIRRHGLDDAYSKILTKEMIESIVNGNSNDAVSLFKSCSEKQQQIIVNMLFEKIQSNPDSVDLNLVDKISRASGIKIQEMAEEAKEYRELLNDSNQ